MQKEEAAPTPGSRIAVVTGAAGGLGRAIGDALRAQGHIVIGLDLKRPDDVDPALFHTCDLGDLTALDDLVTRIERENGPIAVWVNNAAHVSTRALDDLTIAEIMATLTVNVAAVLLLCRSVANCMAGRGHGAIVNIASIAGLRGSSQADYGASKAGVINLTRTLARHYAARGVRINAVAPGLVDSGMGTRLSDSVREALIQATPIGRGARPEEIAEVVAFLASDAASYITAETIGVHGGI